MRRIEASHVHKRQIATTLRSLDRALALAEDATRRTPPPSAVMRYVDPLSDASGAELRDLVAEARRQIEAIASDLGLESHDESVTRTLLGHLHVGVVNVEELRPRFLRSGGEVPPALAAYIEPKAIELEGTLWSLIRALERHLHREGAG